MEALLKGGNVFIDGTFHKADLFLKGGRVAGILTAESIDCTKVSEGVTVFDFSDKYIFPGFTDVHVHFREPGFSYKEDILTGSMAAAHGGYTNVCTMPNLSPVPDCMETLSEELNAINNKAIINVCPYGSITRESMGNELSEMEELADSVVAFSDDGKGVCSTGLMREAFIKAKELNKLIAAHCEFKELMGGAHVHAGKAAELLNLQGISSESEWKMIERDLELAKETGAAYHVCHISTKESVELIRKAKSEGVNVTCETGPHYLLMDEDNLVEFLNSKQEEEQGSMKLIPADFKMNPPLRSHEDRLALIEALRDGTLDMIATDHAPHSAEEKERGILGAPMGIVGLESAFPLLYTYLVKPGVIELEELVGMMSVIPAARFGIKSGIAIGAPADITAFDLDCEKKVDPAKFLSKGRSTPFKGWTVNAECLMTICGGEIVYSKNPENSND